MRLQTRFPFVSVVLVNGVLVPVLLAMQDPLIYREFKEYALQFDSSAAQNQVALASAIPAKPKWAGKTLRHWQIQDFGSGIGGVSDGARFHSERKLGNLQASREVSVIPADASLTQARCD